VPPDIRFKAKMHQIHFLLGLRPRPRWGAYSAPRPLPLFKGPSSKGMEGNGRGGRKGKVEGRERWREGFGSPKNFGVAPPMRTLYGYAAGVSGKRGVKEERKVG